MQMLMPMPSCRCRDFQMAFLKKQFLLFVLFLTQGKGKHETLFINVNRSTNKYSVPYYDIYQLPTIENYFILYLGFLSRQFANHRTSAEGGGHWTPYYYFYHFRAFLPYVLMCLRAFVPSCFTGFTWAQKSPQKNFPSKISPFFVQCSILKTSVL